MTRRRCATWLAAWPLVGVGLASVTLPAHAELAPAGGAVAVDAPGREGRVARASEARTYRAVGVIKAFGPARGYANIAHEAIPGYMGAMTMSFWPQRAEQFDGLVVGDPVAFEFSETEDARRILVSIRKAR